MNDTLRYPPTNVLARARREMLILDELKNGAMTQKQLAEKMDINPRTLKGIIRDLVHAGVVCRVATTHKVALWSQ